MTTCPIDDEALWRLSEATEFHDTDREVRRHVEQCADCQARLDALQQFNVRLESVGDLPLPRLPERIGPYTIVRRIGEGGMGVVYEAEQEQTGRCVALKVIRQSAGSPRRRASIL